MSRYQIRPKIIKTYLNLLSLSKKLIIAFVKRSPENCFTFGVALNKADWIEQISGEM